MADTESINDLSKYKLRIKIKELETGIIRYSYPFSYGLHLNKLFKINMTI